MIENKLLNIPEAAEILSVSEATVRNWIKSGVLNKTLTALHVNTVKTSINSGELERLNKRANKSNSAKSFVPSEYANDTSVNEDIEKLLELSEIYFQTIDEKIYNIAIAFVQEKSFVEDIFVFKRNAVNKCFEEYNDKKYKPNIDFISALNPIILNLKASESHDVLGLIYQSLLSEGDKSQKGSYYTPQSIIDEMVNNISDSIKTFMDPCCGTGAYLLSAAKNKKIAAENIFGADMDKTAVFLARLNILDLYKDYDEIPNIYNLDSLNQLATGDFFCETNFLLGKIDAIATNPPWGASKNSSPSEKYEKILESREIFSMFILKSMELLRKGGELNFLLPEAILNIQTHKKIRKTLCSHSKIVSVIEFGRAFTGVFTPVISIHAIMDKKVAENIVRIKNESKEFFVKQERFSTAKNFVFDVKIDNTSEKIIRKIYSIPHQTLKGNAKWALGIVTGDNKKHLKSCPDENLEPIFKGSDISYYYLDSPKNFIHFDRKQFQQVAKEEYYRADEKLVYKFISNKIVFAYDDKKSLTLNSANILIPGFSDLEIKAVLAFLNSSVFQFLHRVKFSTHKILRGDLEELPFPIISKKTQNKIITFVNLAISGDNDAIADINTIVCEIFELDKAEIEHINKYTK